MMNNIIEMIMPELGESILEGTILKWLKAEGETVKEEEPLLEVATDKVNTEILATHSGILKKQLFQEGEVIKIGKSIALIALASDSNTQNISKSLDKDITTHSSSTLKTEQKEERFYSPLVKKISKEENIQMEELNKIKGHGKAGRVTKDDILNYIETKKIVSEQKNILPKPESIPYIPNKDEEIIEMSNVKRVIAERMLESKTVAAHVTTFSEVDVTGIVKWREKIKDTFLKKENIKLTYTPIFIQALVQALKDYEMVNVSIQDNKIIKKKSIHIGIATALSDGNLIVPVIRDADTYNLKGLAIKANNLVHRARNNILTPQDVGYATYTMSNIGMFDALMGTPIILQPQVAIMAFGAIKKKVAVIETGNGDTIGIRYKMYLSHSYDHRIINGALGSLFAQRVGEYIENFSID